MLSEIKRFGFIFCDAFPCSAQVKPAQGKAVAAAADSSSEDSSSEDEAPPIKKPKSGLFSLLK